MKLKIFSAIATFSVIAFFMTACEKDYKNETPTPPPTPPSASWSENFTDFNGLGSRGWVIINNTDKPGPEAWRRGRFESTNKATFGFDYVVGFPAHSADRSAHDFISVDMYAGAQVANMSVWLITPVTKIKNGDQLEFWTRSRVDDGTFTFFKDGNDRLQVRANFNNTSTNVGSEWTTVGDFNTLALDINPNLAVLGYPQTWTKFTYTVSGVTGTINGRFAFRYYIPGGGPDGNNAGLIGVDDVVFTSN